MRKVWVWVWFQALSFPRLILVFQAWLAQGLGASPSGFPGFRLGWMPRTLDHAGLGLSTPGRCKVLVGLARGLRFLQAEIGLEILAQLGILSPGPPRSRNWNALDKRVPLDQPKPGKWVPGSRSLVFFGWSLAWRPPQPLASDLPDRGQTERLWLKSYFDCRWCVRPARQHWAQTAKGCRPWCDVARRMLSRSKASPHAAHCLWHMPSLMTHWWLAISYISPTNAVSAAKAPNIWCRLQA